MTFEIDISNRQKTVAVDCRVLRAALIRALQMEQVDRAVLSVTIVNNTAIHALNRDHLQHDYPTDVISFQLSFQHSDEVTDDATDPAENNTAGDAKWSATPQETHTTSESDTAACDGPARSLRAAGAFIEGEIIASAEMASEMAGKGQWPAQAELTLYVIHGFLHICGYDDLETAEKLRMRARETAILKSLGLYPVYSDDSP